MTSRPPADNDTLRFMQQVWGLAHALDVRSKQMARTLGVTGPQRLVIRFVGRRPDATPTELAQILGLHPSTVTGVLARLERQGMLERRIDRADRRRKRFRLTARGKQVDKHRKGTVEDAIQRALARSTATMIDATERMLAVVVAELEK